MMQLTYAEVSRALNAKMKGVDGVIQHISIDTRNLKSGATFVALKGKNYDAHDFIVDSIKAGAASVIVDHEVSYPVTQIIVEDTRKALGDLAKLWRKKFNVPVIAVTGSNGKTTVKEMLFSILSEYGSTLSTLGNLNNDIGVPLTLLRFSDEHRFAVIEMGANHPGEIAYLTKMALPDIALITNAGPAHLEGFGSVEAVAHAKGEIFSCLTANGVAIFNEDDKYADVWREMTQHCRRFGFSLSLKSGAVVKGEYNIDNILAIDTPSGKCRVKLSLQGQHNAYNALAAATAALSVGVGLENISIGLQKVRPVPGRLTPIQGIKGIQILDDSYNANPASLEAGLEVLTKMEGRHWLILGDMGELGAESEKIHTEMGRLAKRAGIDCLFTFGELSAKAAKAFGKKAFSYKDDKLLANEVIASADRNINILIKGSRSMRMERIVKQLTVGSDYHVLHSDVHGGQ